MLIHSINIFNVIPQIKSMLISGYTEMSLKISETEKNHKAQCEADGHNKSYNILLFILNNSR